MHKLLISAAIAGLITVSGSALAQDAHHDHAAPLPAAATPAPKPMPMACSHMKADKNHARRGKTHKMACMKGMHDGHQMMNGGMDQGHMQQMHDQMTNGGMMGGAKPSATPSPSAPK